MNQFVLFALLAGLAQSASLNDLNQITELDSGIPTAVTFPTSNDDGKNSGFNIHETIKPTSRHEAPTYDNYCSTPLLRTTLECISMKKHKDMVDKAA